MIRITAAIVGAKYHAGAAEMLAELPDNAMILLRREPANPHDHNAIGVFYRQQRLGFIEAARAQEIALLMDARGLPMMTARFDKTDGRNVFAAVELVEHRA